MRLYLSNDRYIYDTKKEYDEETILIFNLYYLSGLSVLAIVKRTGIKKKRVFDVLTSNPELRDIYSDCNTKRYKEYYNKLKGGDAK